MKKILIIGPSWVGDMGNDGGGLGKAEAVEEGTCDKEDDRQEKRHHKDSPPFSRTPLVG